MPRGQKEVMRRGSRGEDWRHSKKPDPRHRWGGMIQTLESKDIRFKRYGRHTGASGGIWRQKDTIYSKGEEPSISGHVYTVAGSVLSSSAQADALKNCSVSAVGPCYLLLHCYFPDVQLSSRTGNRPLTAAAAEMHPKSAFGTNW